MGSFGRFDLILVIIFDRKGSVYSSANLIFDPDLKNRILCVGSDVKCLTSSEKLSADRGQIYK
jgi:hypothetical protein